MGRSYQPESWVRNPKASFGVKALAGALSSYANAEFGNQDVWPSPATVAEHLAVSTRHVQDLSAEGERLGWWTRIHERTRFGGVKLTWRLHFPEFSESECPTEPERNCGSDGRVEGFKVGRVEEQIPPSEVEPVQAPLALAAPEAVKKNRKEPPAGLLLVQLWNEPETRGIARLEPKNIRLANRIVNDTGEENLRWYFREAELHPYWSGKSNAATIPFAKILSYAGWDAFCKDLDKSFTARTGCPAWEPDEPEPPAPPPKAAPEPEEPDPFDDFDVCDVCHGLKKAGDTTTHGCNACHGEYTHA